MSRITLVAVLSIALLGWIKTANALDMKWGSETDFRKEVDSLSTLTGWEEAEQIFSGRSVRFFSDNTPTEPLMRCFDRHWEAWDAFKATGGDVESREDFYNYKKQEDPSCSYFAQTAAPLLYFDFVAPTNDEYVLQRIEITTLAFSEYKGGGFFDSEAWYDILLSHEEGVKSYDVDQRLRFSGSGRAVLRLWSDNFYPNAGWMAPEGAYILDIKFIFSAGGREVSVSTGPFAIDV